MKPHRRRLLLVACLGVALGSTGCVGVPPDTQGRDVKGLYDFFTYFAAVIFVITAGLIAWSIIRYRKKPDDDQLPPQFQKHIPLEIAWFAIPQVIVIILFIASTLTLSSVNKLDPNPDMTLNVTGFQWGWNFGYADSGVTIHSTPDQNATIYLPEDQTIEFRITSQDVIHSFYLPALLSKRDAIPGHTNRIDLNITDPGTYVGRCAEYCGLFHNRMSFDVKVVSDGEFQSWLAQQQQQAQP